ncbi:MAG: T9SS type A sorting domain-containing protein [Ignavibacteria bacterium]|nr:T9SS type A sorting domain-containing protein [Ignavibacteria bacterium]
MKNSKQNFEDLFNSAKNEPVGFTADEAQTIVHGADVRSHRRKPIMILAFALSSVVMATAMLFGVRAVFTPTDSPNQTPNTPPTQTVDVTPSPLASAPEYSTTKAATNSTTHTTTNSTTNTTPNSAPNSLPKTSTHKMNSEAPNHPQIPAPFVTVYSPGIELNNLPGVDDDFVKAALANGSNTDSIVVIVKSVNSNENTQVTVFTNGKMKTFDFTKDASQIPYMITTTSGRGCRVSNNAAAGLDPNQMLPVAANLNNTDVLLWYPATMNVVRGFPDSLQSEIENSLNIKMVNVEKHAVMFSDAEDLANPSFIRLNSMNTKALCLDSSRMQVHSQMFVIDDDSDQIVIESDNQADDDTSANIKRVNKVLIRKRIESPDSDLVDYVNIETIRDIDVKAKELKIKEVNFSAKVDSILKSMPWSKSLRINSQEFSDIEGSTARKCVVAQTRIIILSPKNRRGTKQTIPINSVPSLQETRTKSASVTDSKVFPNPTWEKGATLDYTLAQPNVITVNVFSLDGKVVQSIIQSSPRPAGNHQLPFVLTDVQPGMYMVVLTTQSGEQVVQRLIVN